MWMMRKFAENVDPETLVQRTKHAAQHANSADGKKPREPHAAAFTELID